MTSPADTADHDRRIRELEAMVAHLEATLDHFLHNREAATELAKRNYADVSRFGAGAVLRGLPGSVRQSTSFRLKRLRLKRRIMSLNRHIRSRSTGAIQPEGWKSATPLPRPRFEARAAVLEQHLYLFAGFRRPREQIEPSCWRFSPNTDRWTEIASMPLPVTHTGIGVVGTDIWLAGGFAGDNPGPATTRVQIYDTLEDKWRAGPSLPTHVGSVASTMDGSRLHIVGGLDPDRKTDVLDHLVLDTSETSPSWDRLAPLPPPGRNHHSAAGLEGQIYVLGGHSGHDGPLTDLNIVDAYEPETDSWRRINSLPEARHHCEASTFAWQGRVVVAGGLGPGRIAPLPDLVAYDPTADTWESLGLMPRPLWGTTVQPVGDALIATTGSTHTHKGATGLTWTHPLPATSQAP